MLRWEVPLKAIKAIKRNVPPGEFSYAALMPEPRGHFRSHMICQIIM